MFYWNYVIDKISEPNTKLVYIAIGSGMGHYTQITESNNQQYPCFLDKFDGRKVVILIDPDLESPLKVESYFENLNNQLRLVRAVTNPDEDDEKHSNDNRPKPPHIFRQFTNSNIDLFAINTSYDYQFYDRTTPYERTKIDGDIAKMIDMIFICLGKVNKTKMIVQDYTGRDINHFYISMFKFFNKKEILNNVLFDVTQNDGGCFFDIKPSMAQVDSENNFIQERYSKLTQYTRSPFYDQILKTRIDILNYPISYYYFKLSESPVFGVNNLDRLNLWFAIYEIEWDSENKNPDYLKTKFLELSRVMIEDIVDSRSCGADVKKYLSDNITNRSVFINTLSILKFD